MKGIVRGILPAVLLLALCACGGTGEPSAPEDTPTREEPMGYAFEAQYIRTGGGWEEEYPQSLVLRSREELEAYYEENREHYDLGRREQVYSDTTIGFWDACDKYDEAWFEEQDLVLLLVSEGSGSNRHEVTDVRREGSEWQFTVRRILPEVGTCDVAIWHILVEIQMGKVIGDEETTRVILVEEEVLMEEVPG